jgi:hypothetical protein
MAILLQARAVASVVSLLVPAYGSTPLKGASMRKVAFGIHTLLLSLSLGWSPLVRADAVTDWNANASKAALAACISPYLDPLHESRMYAMMHIAIHDALNAIQRHSRPYALDL